MNEQLQGKLVEILSGIQSATKAAGDFALEQLPDIAQQYVMYGRVWGLLSVLLTLVLATCLLAAARWFHRNPWRGDFGEDRGFTSVLAMCGSALFAFLALASSFAQAGHVALAFLAPKVWLLKELASLVK